MINELSERISTARRGVRRIVWWYGISWLVVGVLTVLVIACTTDWLFHVSAGMRFLFALALAGVAGAVAWFRLLAPLSVNLSDLQLALRIERLHPELEEALSSTVSLSANAPQAELRGSPELQEAVRRLADERSRTISFDDVLNPRPGRRAALWAAAIGILSVTLVAIDPVSASIALRRLANPLSGPAWPRRTNIASVDYSPKIAKGDPFQVAATVTGVVPGGFDIEYRFADGSQPAPTPMQPSVDAPAKFLATLEVAQVPFEFMIRGGDAQTDWLKVDVVPAPDVQRLAVRLEPPAYTRQPPVEYPEGRGHIEAVVGTKVSLEATSNKSLKQGRLLWKSGAATDGAVAQDARTLIASFLVHQPDSYRILLEDEQGMTNEHRSPKDYRVEAIADRAPEVAFEQPTADQDVTRSAKIPFRAILRDDFGVDDAELRYVVERPGAPPADPAAAALPFEAIPIFDAGDAAPLNQLAPYEWDLAPMSLPVGSVIAVRCAARDYRDNPGPNVGESREIRLRIVSEADFIRQLDAEQKLVREEIERVMKLEENALAQTRDLAEAARNDAKLDPTKFEKLQSTETIQRRIHEKTSQGQASIQEKIRELLSKMASNNVNDLDTAKRLSLMDSELARLDEQHLTAIDQSLTQARKSAALPTKTDDKNPPTSDQSVPSNEKLSEKDPLAEHLDKAREDQERVVESLGTMLEQLDKWESVAEVVNEARELESRQAETGNQVEALAAKSLGKSQEELTGEEKAELAKTAGRQEEIRQQLGRLERKMTRQAEKSKSFDPSAAQAISDALEKSREGNLGGKMSQAADNVRQNRLADARQSQEEVQKALRELVESLENRQEQELKRLVKELKEAEEQLEQIGEEQKRLRKQTADAEAIADAQKRAEELQRLRQRQAELQRKAEEFARRLSQLQAKSASQASGRAASRMNDAADSMENSQGEQAGQEQEEALEQLDQAQQQLAQKRREVEEQLAREQLAKVADSIKGIHERQRAIAGDAARLRDVKKEAGKLTRGQIQSLIGLSRAEQGLAEESAALKERLTEAKVFSLVIEEAVELMKAGAAQLADRSAEDQTVRDLEKAAGKFAQLIDSLRDDPTQQKTAKGQQQGGGEGEGGAGGDQDGIPSLAQIKLLRSLQQEILADTKELSLAQADQPLNDEQKTRFEKLAQRQGRLADLVSDFMQPVEDEEPSDEAPTDEAPAEVKP
jgi:hypothetical protein